MYENIGISPKGKLYLWGVGILVVLIIAAIIWAILGTIVLVGKVIVRFIVPITIGVGIYFVYKILRDK